MGELFKKHCLTLEFMGELGEPMAKFPMGGFSDFLKRADGLLNSESTDRLFG